VVLGEDADFLFCEGDDTKAQFGVAEVDEEDCEGVVGGGREEGGFVVAVVG
jgi:hypothetical protein